MKPAFASPYVLVCCRKKSAILVPWSNSSSRCRESAGARPWRPRHSMLVEPQNRAQRDGFHTGARAVNVRRESETRLGWSPLSRRVAR